MYNRIFVKQSVKLTKIRENCKYILSNRHHLGQECTKVVGNFDEGVNLVADEPLKHVHPTAVTPVNIARDEQAILCIRRKGC